jgi:LSU ribosomal protein L12AE
VLQAAGSPARRGQSQDVGCRSEGGQHRGGDKVRRVRARGGGPRGGSSRGQQAGGAAQQGKEEKKEEEEKKGPSEEEIAGSLAALF